MKKSYAKGLAVLICILMVSQLAFFPVKAQQPQPRYTNTSSLTITLDFSGTTASIDAIVFGNANVDLITGKAWLEELDSSGNVVSIVKEWRNLSALSDCLMFAATCPVKRGKTYRANLKAHVYAEGTSKTKETVEISIERTCN